MPIVTANIDAVAEGGRFQRSPKTVAVLTFAFLWPLVSWLALSSFAPDADSPHRVVFLIIAFTISFLPAAVALLRCPRKPSTWLQVKLDATSLSISRENASHHRVPQHRFRGAEVSPSKCVFYYTDAIGFWGAAHIQRTWFRDESDWHALTEIADQVEQRS